MKPVKLFLALLIFAAANLFTGCDEFGDYFYDDVPPSPPKGIYTVTGDERVDLFWDENPEGDVAGYNVYYAYSYDGKYTLLGSTYDNSYIDYGAKNGTTYYYAVTAYDYNNNESDLSSEVIYDTPRPEGFNQALFDYNRSPNNSGYDFSKYLVVAYNSDATDFFFENYNGTYYLNVWDDTDIQDMGTTGDIWDISYAPSSGWVPMQPNENVKYVEAKVGHTYVIWTWDNHFAKVRIRSISNDRMVFDWAYQLVEGNRELKRAALPNGRSSHSNLKKNR